MFLRDISPMVEESKKAKFLPNGIVQTLIALALVIVSQVFVGIFVTVLFLMLGKGVDFVEKNEVIIGLYTTIATILVTILYVFVIEKRSLYSMGFGLKHAVRDYFVGFIIGIAMFSSVVLMLYATNNLNYKGLSMQVFPMLIVLFIGFLFQGASEEIVLRGYLMNSLGARHNLVIAVIVNSTLFGLLHLANSHVNFISIINIIFFGVFASIYALKFNNIWGVMALHSSWNFVQGNIYGLPVSGINIDTSIMIFEETGKNYITGGAFGPEGGLAVTIILLISTIIVYNLKIKNDNL